MPSRNFQWFMSGSSDSVKYGRQNRKLQLNPPFRSKVDCKPFNGWLKVAKSFEFGQTTPIEFCSLSTQKSQQQKKKVHGPNGVWTFHSRFRNFNLNIGTLQQLAFRKNRKGSTRQLESDTWQPALLSYWETIVDTSFCWHVSCTIRNSLWLKWKTAKPSRHNLLNVSQLTWLCWLSKTGQKTLKSAFTQACNNPKYTFCTMQRWNHGVKSHSVNPPCRLGLPPWVLRSIPPTSPTDLKNTLLHLIARTPTLGNYFWCHQTAVKAEPSIIWNPL